MFTSGSWKCKGLFKYIFANGHVSNIHQLKIKWGKNFNKKTGSWTSTWRIFGEKFLISSQKYNIYHIILRIYALHTIKVNNFLFIWALQRFWKFKKSLRMIIFVGSTKILCTNHFCSWMQLLSRLALLDYILPSNQSNFFLKCKDNFVWPTSKDSDLNVKSFHCNVEQNFLKLLDLFWMLPHSIHLQWHQL